MSTALERPDRPVADPDADDDDGPTRVTVNLSVLSVAALMLVRRITRGESKTDVINKALQFYAMVKEVIHNGGAIYIREPGAKEAERIRIL